MEKLNSDFKDLIFIDFHHHNQVPEAVIANLNTFLVVYDCKLDPGVLILKKFAIKVGNPSG